MSCEAAESVEDAVLRMARVNCNLIPLQHHRFSCRRLYDFDLRIFLIHQLFKPSRIDMLRYRRECVVKMIQQNPLGLQSLYDLQRYCFQEFASLERQNQKIGTLRVFLILLQSETSPSPARVCPPHAPRTSASVRPPEISDSNMQVPAHF